jgi:hypothetical protein
MSLCVLYSRAEQIPGVSSPWRLNFALWRLIFVGPQYGIFFNVSLLVPRILRWLLDFWKLFGPLLYKELDTKI